MGRVTIDYSEINDAAKRAKIVAGHYEEFADELDKNVSKKLSGLSGTDSRGYIRDAKTIVSTKVKELKNKKEYYLNLSKNIQRLAESCEFYEQNIVWEVKKTATDAFELHQQGKWSAFSQWIYGTFCVELVNWNPITRCMGNGIKQGFDKMHEIGTKILNWFKHGNGKYTLGIVFDGLSIVASLAGTIGAIGLAVTAIGGASIIVAAVAATVVTVLTIGDSVVSIVNKCKALKIEADTGDPGRARYYGNIGKVSDTIKKHDYGGSLANEAMECVGDTYDTVHAVAKVTAIVVGMYQTMAGKDIVQSETWKKQYKTCKTVKKIVSWPKKIYTKIHDVKTAISKDKSIYQRTRKILNIIADTKLSIAEPISELNKIFKIVDLVGSIA